MKAIRIVLIVVILLYMTGFVMAAQNVSSLPRNETFYRSGQQWGPVNSYNVLAGTRGWPMISPNRLLIYENLFAYNMLTSEMEPLLATEYTWVNNLTMDVALDRNARFQNGTPLTAEDVVYSYKLGQKYNAHFSSLWESLEDIKALDQHTVRFIMRKDNPNRLLLLHYLQYVFIVSKDIYQAKEEEFDYDETELRQWPDLNPVGSGPYKVFDLSDERVVLVRDDNHWAKYKKGLPRPRYIVHPIFKSNDAGNRALEQGNIDLSQQFIPRVWEMSLVKDLPVGTWYDDTPYHIPYAIPTLIINHTRKPMDDVNFRRALAYAIDYTKIPALAMSRYSEVVKSSFLLPGEEYFSEENIADYGWEYNPAKAEEILQEAGYTKGADGFYRTPDGARIRLTVECPYGWTDWMVTLKIVAQSAQKVGLDLRTEFPEYAPLNDRIMNGDFDLVMSAPPGYASPSQPWNRFKFMYSADIGPVGELAFRNFGRYRSEEADELIKAIPMITEQAEIVEAYNKLDRILMKDVAAIPLVYRAWQFYTFNETHWTGFADAENPYAPPQDGAIGAGIKLLYNIEPVQ